MAGATRAYHWACRDMARATMWVAWRKQPWESLSAFSWMHDLHAGSVDEKLGHPRQQPPTPRPAPPPTPRHLRSSSATSYSRPRGLRIVKLTRSCLPVLLYILTSLAFVVAITLYKSELFRCLSLSSTF
jgi:hypothetical protein